MTIPRAWWWIGGGAAVAGIAWWNRNALVQVGRTAVAAGREGAFAEVLPGHIEPYADVILRVAREEAIDPFVIVALGERESRWGQALDADGTGDKTGRKGAWLGHPSSRAVGTLPSGWNTLGASPPYAIPSDGLGWGRGIMQIDWGSFYVWLAANPWRDPYVNVGKGARLLRQKRDFLAARGVTDPMLWPASIAAYNHGEGNVLRSIQAGEPIDTGTAGGDYSTAVARLAADLTRKFLAMG